ncbi:LysR family transcriptional regulator [Aestuariispira insulae]|uniref:LysR family transcriptional regulator n=1 Tax=Aestuariispira insulae TaxID=1461337 RepID=A0A3D9HAF5_9PROT|nr:LysR family transcriptional regulator [Aestuariispira insulae]RED46161.1 LysR family transcriptional regulator [Aestuariispira insulae]
MYDDLALFVNIVRHRGLGAAANQLNLPPATVTRRLAKLEDSLGCRLIHRSARRFELTTEGEAYFAAYADLLDQMETQSRRLSRDMHQLAGRLKVAAPTNLSQGILMDMWSAFLGTQPDIQLELVLSNHIHDLEAAQIDLAIRIGPLSDSQLTCKKLGVISCILVASPDYLSKRGTPETLEDLSGHQVIFSRLLTRWHLRQQDTGQQQIVHPTSRVVVDDMYMAVKLAADGHGLLMMPVSEGAEDMRRNRLRRILPDWQGPDREIHAVWPTGRLLTARARCFLDKMERYFSSQPILNGQIPALPD